MDENLKPIIEEELEAIRKDGLYKDERAILSSQGAEIVVMKEGMKVINFCANNYLGLASDKRLVKAAREGLNKYGYGLSSVRFICGTQDIHKKLERNISDFLGTEDTILYSSCFDANSGLFEPIMKQGDVIVSDRLNHASIIDGVRLCRADKKIYEHMNTEDLEQRLRESRDYRLRMICTDSVFSMDGDLAPLPKICDLAEKYNALVMIDDSHATGFIGRNGRGVAEHFNVADRIDIITSTLGKALGGATGGFASGKGYIIEYLRQKSRPYLFSNSVAPVIVYTSLRAIDILKESDQLRIRLMSNTRYLREKMTEQGFDIREGTHPIVPIMLGEAKLAKDMADDMLKEGIYVIGFSYPVVPKGEARIRVQISAAHTKEQLDKAINAFEMVGRRYGVIK